MTATTDLSSDAENCRRAPRPSLFVRRLAGNETASPTLGDVNR
jgi:hypothetical protein